MGELFQGLSLQPNRDAKKGNFPRQITVAFLTYHRIALNRTKILSSSVGLKRALAILNGIPSFSVP
jgi:hypothetical protein